jgi:hypothetical protein
VWIDSGTAEFQNTIVAGNSAKSGAVSDVSGRSTSLGHNLIGSADGSSGWDAAKGDQFGSAAVLLDPRLQLDGTAGSLAIDAGVVATDPTSGQLLKNNGGPTDTIALGAVDVTGGSGHSGSQTSHPRRCR